MCTLIDESEVLQCQAAEETATRLATEFPELRVGLVHGRLKAEQKEQQMSAFKAGEKDLLRDEELLVSVEQAAGLMLENCPQNVALLIRRWLGAAADYGEV